MREHIRKGRRGAHHDVPYRRMRGGLQPWLLLLLQQKPGYGYELLERLSKGEHAPDADSGFLYRTLRWLEESGMVVSSWDTEGQGPARRLYEVTPEGIEYLHSWAANLRVMRQRFDHFLAEYEKIAEIEKENRA